MTEEQYLGPQQTRGRNRRPFMAGGVDPQLLSRRDFCGDVPGERVERHEGSHGRTRRRERRERVLWRSEGWERERGVREMAGGAGTVRKTRFEGEYLDERALNQHHLIELPPEAVRNAAPTSNEDDDEIFSSAGTSATTSTLDSSADSGSEAEGVATETETCSRQLRRHLLSKYLRDQHGNGRMGMDSPARQIESKLDALMQECGECRVCL